jgi:RNA polymerase sigma factor (sigma-70 family)
MRPAAQSSWWGGILLRFEQPIFNSELDRMIVRRNDDQWVHDLGSEDAALRDDAVGDLRDMLYRGLAKGLSKHGRVDDAFLEDIVQEASIKILEKLDGFEGRSKFRTWAVTIAVRTAISKMRKREWQNVSLESLASDGNFEPQVIVDAFATGDQENSRSFLLSKLKELIDSELTEKQWMAITAELAGMPPEQIAEKLSTNANAIYKLMHDARKKLRRGLEASGFTIEDIREAWA